MCSNSERYSSSRHTSPETEEMYEDGEVARFGLVEALITLQRKYQHDYQHEYEREHE